jgi:FkbH-like protein
VTNRGTLVLGDRVRFHCELGSTHVQVLDGATLEIGDRAVVNYGTDIAVAGLVRIGDGVSIGPRCIIADTPYDSTRRDAPTDHSAIVIEDDVWLAARVTVMPGAHIGAGSVITAGSVVEGPVPPGVVAGGNPVRIVRRLADSAPDVRDDLRRKADAPPAADVADDLDGVHARTSVRVLLISDFTVDPLAGALTMTPGGFDWQVDVAPFNAVVPTLIAPPAQPYDLSVVWTRPDAVLPTFASVLDGERVTAEALGADVDALAALIERGLAGHRCVVVPTWTVPPWHRDGRDGGVTWALSVVNARLIGTLGQVGNVRVVDSDDWFRAAYTTDESERAWYLAKVPFDDSVFDRAARAVREVAAAIVGGEAPRKLVVVDLDNTLWGGVVGDLGWEGLRLGGHDADGEAFVDFQRGLARLRKRGVLLAIASKNEEHAALEVFDRNELMVLGRGDFVAWRIDWNDKAASIASMAAELNLGLQSVVFIDDSPHERQRVRDALPEVLVPEWPAEPTSYPRALASLRCFPSAVVSDEDARRTEMYHLERERDALRSEVSSLDDWIADLGIVVRMVPLDIANRARATQLLNKTNQMNLTTRRMSEDELSQWASAEGRRVLCAHVTDRLGDSGLTGIVSVEAEGTTARLVDFVLSCRVMGRQVEAALLHVASVLANDLGASELVADVKPTAKNAPCQRFFEESTMRRDPDGSFRADVSAVPAPTVIQIDWQYERAR